MAPETLQQLAQAVLEQGETMRSSHEATPQASQDGAGESERDAGAETNIDPDLARLLALASSALN